MKKKERWREKFKPWLLSHLGTAGRPWHEVGVSVRLLVSESQQSTVVQLALLKKHTGSLKTRSSFSLAVSKVQKHAYKHLRRSLMNSLCLVCWIGTQLDM